MINPIELIQEYKDQGYSYEEAVQMAKAELKEKKATNLANNKQAELNRITVSRSFMPKHSVIYEHRNR